MKKLSIIALVFMLTATILAGCRAPDPATSGASGSSSAVGTTGATENNPTSSTVRPEPTVTLPGTSNSANDLGRMGPRM